MENDLTISELVKRARVLPKFEREALGRMLNELIAERDEEEQGEILESVLEVATNRSRSMRHCIIRKYA